VGGFVERFGFFFAILAVAAASVFYRQSRISALLDSWASRNGLAIVKRTYGLFRQGPFFLTLGHQVVYRLVVRDSGGVERGCWVRLGSFFMGLLSDDVEVRWEQSDRVDASGKSGGFGVV
jgi:hypothetical protein